MDWISLIMILATIDIAGRICALLMLSKNGNVKHLKYRTWVLLCALLNFAWVFYVLIGRGKKNV